MKKLLCCTSVWVLLQQYELSSTYPTKCKLCSSNVKTACKIRSQKLSLSRVHIYYVLDAGVSSISGDVFHQSPWHKIPNPQFFSAKRLWFWEPLRIITCFTGISHPCYVSWHDILLTCTLTTVEAVGERWLVNCHHDSSCWVNVDWSTFKDWSWWWALIGRRWFGIISPLNASWFMPMAWARLTTLCETTGVVNATRASKY